MLKDALLDAATQEGSGDLVVFLRKMAREYPVPFLNLLGRVLPLQIDADPNGPPVAITQVTHIVIDAKEQLEQLRALPAPTNGGSDDVH
jgi:hypothetical protein